MNKINNKKGASTITPEFLITLLVSVAMILLVTGLVYMLWGIISPSQDKNSKSSLVALHSLMESESQVMLPYDSKQFNVYLADNYQIFYFGSGSPSYWECGKDSDEKIYRPSKCKEDACLCLYKQSPHIFPSSITEQDKDINKKDEGVVSCKSFTSEIIVTKGSFELNDGDCKRVKGNFFDVLVGERTTNPTGIISTNVFVKLATEEALAQDSKDKKSTCPISANNVCSGEKDGTLLTSQIPSDNMYSKVLTQCKSQTPPRYAIQATCVLDAVTNECTLNCDQRNFMCDSTTAAKVKTCEDYNKYSEYGTFVSGRNYFVKEPFSKVSATQWACLNDKEICGVLSETPELSCYEKELKVYACLDDSCTIEEDMSLNCNFKFDDNNLITEYDTTNQECTTFMRNNFISVNQYYCKKGKETECSDFVSKNKKECSIVSKGTIVVLSYKPIGGCDSEIKKLYDPTYSCSTPILIELDENVVVG